jgi:hypothetical protein
VILVDRCPIEGFVAYRPRCTGPSTKRDLKERTGQDQGTARTGYQHKRLDSLALQVKDAFPFSDTQPGIQPHESPRLNPYSFSRCGTDGLGSPRWASLATRATKPLGGRAVRSRRKSSHHSLW